MAPGSVSIKRCSTEKTLGYHLVLLAENNQDTVISMKIVSAGFVDCMYYKPRVDLEVLEKYHEGLSR